MAILRETLAVVSFRYSVGQTIPTEHERFSIFLSALRSTLCLRTRFGGTSNRLPTLRQTLRSSAFATQAAQDKGGTLNRTVRISTVPSGPLSPALSSTQGERAGERGASFGSWWYYQAALNLTHSS
jgi:hypothetical protein